MKQDGNKQEERQNAIIGNPDYTENKITNDVKKTAEYWSKYYDTIIVSPTGFPNVNEFDWDNTLLTEKQFLEYAETSTIKFNEKIISALNQLKHERIENLM